MTLADRQVTIWIEWGTSMKSVLVATLIALGTGSAAYAAPPCPAATGDIKPAKPKGKPADFYGGFPASFLLALDPATFPREEIAEQKNACTRGTFEVGGKAYVVYGEDNGTPPRWAMAEGDERIAFLAVMPAPEEALKWARSKNRSNAMTFGTAMYSVAVTAGNKRDVYAILEAIPGDSELASLFERVLNGELRPFARYDTATGETDAVSE